MDEVRALLDLLAIPSPSGQEDAACEAFARQATGQGFRVERDAVGNVIASMGAGRPHVMFLGHIDTVPGYWPVKIEDGKIHARGAVDAKGALVAGLFAAARIGEASPGKRTVVAAVGEEGDSRGVLEILRRPPPDALIVGEPSGWDRVTIGYRGQRIGTYQVTAALRHASSPVPGALDLAVETAARLMSAFGRSSNSSPLSGPSVRIVDWKYATDGLKELAEFRVDVRAGMGFDWRSLERLVPEIRWSRPLEAVTLDKGNPVVRALVAAIRQEGGAPTYLLKGGTSDMNHAARVWQISMGSYGPGDGNLDHGPEERLPIAEFLQSIRVLERALRILSSAKGVHDGPEGAPDENGG